MEQAVGLRVALDRHGRDDPLDACLEHLDGHPLDQGARRDQGEEVIRGIRHGATLFPPRCVRDVTRSAPAAPERPFELRRPWSRSKGAAD
jgi:hypothetical protein